MSASARNMEAIVKAKEAHNKGCPFPPHTVVMSFFDIERLGWEEGDSIAGLKVRGGEIQPGRFLLLCDGSEAGGDEQVEVVGSRERDSDLVPAGAH